VAATLEVIRLLTVRAKAEGAEQAERALTRIADAQNKVAQSADGMAVATERTDRSVQSSAAQFEKLVRSLDPAVRAQAQYEAGIRTVQRAEAAGVKTSEESARALQLLRERYEKLTSASRQAATGIEEAAAATARANASAASRLSLGGMTLGGSGGANFGNLGAFSAVSTQATGAARAVGLANHEVVQMQAQLSDLAVQITSGGSPFVAIMQQGSQLAPILGAQGGLRGAIAALGAGFMSMLNPVNLTILAIAGVSAGLASWLSAADEAESKALSYGDAMKELDGILGSVGGKTRSHADDIRDVAAAYREAQGEAIKAARAEIAVLQAQVEAAQIMNGAGQFGEAGALAGADIAATEMRLSEAQQQLQQILSQFDTFNDKLTETDRAARAAAGGTDTYVESLRRLSEAIPVDGSLGAVDIAVRFNEARRKLQSDLSVGSISPQDYAGEIQKLIAARDLAHRQLSDPLRGIDHNPTDKPNLLGLEPPAEKAVSDYERTIQAAQQRVASLQAEREALYMTDEAAAAYLKTLELMAAAGNPTDPAQVDEIERQAQAYARASIELQNARRAQDELKRAQEEGKRANEALGNSIVNTLEAITQGGEAAKRAIMQLVLQLAQAALFGQGPLAGLFGAGGLFGGSSAAPAASVASAAANAIIPVESRALPPIAAAASRAANDNSIAGQAWNFFAGKGLAPHQVAGILGNIKAESNFNPSAIGDAGKAFGLFQHWGNRGGGPGMLGNTQAQLELAWRELQTTESGAMARLMASTDVRGATAAFAGFERPQGWSLGNPEGAHNFDGRLAGAQEALAKFGDTATAATDGLGEFSKGAGALGQALSSASSSAAGGGGGGGGGLLGMLFKLGGALLGGGKPASPFGDPNYMPMYADGGIATRPSIFGEAGPEAAVPLKHGRIPVEVRMRDFQPSGGGSTIKMGDVNVNVAGDVSEKNLEVIRREVAKGQRQTLMAVGRQQQNHWRTG
jgi:hypothetical protein